MAVRGGSQSSGLNWFDEAPQGGWSSGTSWGSGGPGFGCVGVFGNQVAGNGCCEASCDCKTEGGFKQARKTVKKSGAGNGDRRQTGFESFNAFIELEDNAVVEAAAEAPDVELRAAMDGLEAKNVELEGLAIELLQNASLVNGDDLLEEVPVIEDNSIGDFRSDL